MDAITSINHITSWFNGKFVKTTYERTLYEKGNPVTKVSHHVIAQLYDNTGKLERLPKQGSNIDKQI